MNWKLVNNKLIKEYSFANQTEVALFLLKVAQIADEHQHHPDVFIYECSKLRLELFTHSTQSISDLDYFLAKQIDLL